MRSISNLLSPSTSISRWLLAGSILALLWGWLAASLLWPALYMVSLIYILIVAWFMRAPDDVLDVQMLCPLYCRWPSTTTWAMSRKEKVPYWPPGCVYKSCCGDDCKSQSILFINTFESCFNWIWYSCLSSHETSPDWRWRSNGQAQSSK